MKNPSGTLLFVDDDEGILRLLSRMMESERMRCHFCRSVDDAIQVLEHESVDTIISDIRMPGKDGFFFLEYVRANPRTRQIPFIVITGDADRNLKRQTLEMGATDLLNKPISREDLVARIRSALRLKIYEDQLANQVEILDQRVKERTRQLESAHREVVWRLAKAAEQRDDATGTHVIRVAVLSRLLAEGLGLSREFLDLIFLTSPLHDIGKLGIPDRILLKRGNLTPEERAIMERHCEMGAQILSQEPDPIDLSSLSGAEIPLVPGETSFNPLLRMGSSIALGHHERWDGSGYPAGIRGEEIPIECRIVTVADVFDALTSSRPYKPPMEPHKAIDILIEAGGVHFDPEITRVLDQHRRKIVEVRNQYEESQGEEQLTSGRFL